MGTFIWSNIIKHIVLISLFVLLHKGFHFLATLSCLKRCWLCVPPVVEVYGGWGLVVNEI